MSAAETVKSENGTPAASAIVKHEERGAAMSVTGNLKMNGLGDVFRLAERLAEARGFVPSVYLQNPNAIAAAILTGAEMGLGPMESMRSIHIVEGKPTVSAELMLARARANGARTRWQVTDEKRATIIVYAPGETEPQTLTVTMAEIDAAGINKGKNGIKDNWRKFPAAMLRARAASAAIRAFCPEVLGASGVYESDSGELTDGQPSAAYIEAQVIPPSQSQNRGGQDGFNGQDAPPPLTLDTVREPDELLGYARTKRDVWSKLKNGQRATAIAKVTESAERVGADPAEVLAVGGLGEPRD